MVVTLTLAAFLGVLRNGFVNWDDPVNFLSNQSYRGLGLSQLKWMFTTFHMGHYIPLTWLTLGADHLVWGMNPMGYHLMSLLFHAATALCFYAVARRLLARMLTMQQVRVWQDSVTLWSHAATLEPDNRFARINLGGAYAAAGRFPEAIDQYREVLKLSPDKAPWYEVLGWLYASSGHVAEGLPLLLEALRLEPGRAGACANAREAVRLLNLPPPPELEACRGAG